MKITDVRTLIVNAEMRNWVLVKVETDEGLYGWGEASLEWKTRAVAGAVEDLKPFILGQDPRRIEHLWQVMVRQPFFPPGIIGMSAISGIEQACWDILGKSVGLPVYQLLGGAVRDRVRMYDHLGGGDMRALYLSTTAGEFVERAQQSVARGYTALKVLCVPRSRHLEGPAAVRYAAGLLEALRTALGYEVDLMVDFHGRTTPAAAIEYARALEPYRPLFIEEPVLPGDVPGMALVARSVATPVATGERLVTRWQFREYLEQRACAVLQPDVCHCGGIWELRKIAAMAEPYNVAMAPHNPLGPVATAVNVHLALCTPNFLIQESIRADVSWRQQLVVEPLEFRDGYVLPPSRPGLGIEIDEDVAAAHPFRQEVLMPWFHEDGSVADW
jgi:galactonate dehydratase